MFNTKNKLQSWFTNFRKANASRGHSTQHNGHPDDQTATNKTTEASQRDGEAQEMTSNRVKEKWLVRIQDDVYVNADEIHQFYEDLKEFRQKWVDTD